MAKILSSRPGFEKVLKLLVHDEHVHIPPTVPQVLAVQEGLRKKIQKNPKRLSEDESERLQVALANVDRFLCGKTLKGSDRLVVSTACHEGGLRFARAN